MEQEGKVEQISQQEYDELSTRIDYVTKMMSKGFFPYDIDPEFLKEIGEETLVLVFHRYDKNHDEKHDENNFYGYLYQALITNMRTAIPRELFPDTIPYITFYKTLEYLRYRNDNPEKSEEDILKELDINNESFKLIKACINIIDAISYDTLSPNIPDSQESVEDQIIEKQRLEQIIDFLEKNPMNLNERSIEIIKLRYGIDSEPHTLAKLAQKYEISIERISQILGKSLKAIRQHIRKEDYDL